MPKPKSGAEVSPNEPAAAKEPAKVDPGEQAKAQAEQSKQEANSTTATKAGKGPKGKGEASGGGGSDQANEASPAKVWFEFQVLDAGGGLMKDEMLKITFQKSGKVDKKKTNADGFVRLEDVDADDALSVELADREDGEWTALGSGERRKKAGG